MGHRVHATPTPLLPQRNTTMCLAHMEAMQVGQRAQRVVQGLGRGPHHISQLQLAQLQPPQRQHRGAVLQPALFEVQGFEAREATQAEHVAGGERDAT